MLECGLFSENPPCKDGHGLLNIDGNICFPSLPAVVEEVVAGKDLLPSPSPHLNLSEIWGEMTISKGVYGYNMGYMVFWGRMKTFNFLAFM